MHNQLFNMLNYKFAICQVNMFEILYGVTWNMDGQVFMTFLVYFRHWNGMCYTIIIIIFFIDLCFYNVYHFHCFMMSYLLLPSERGEKNCRNDSGCWNNYHVPYENYCQFLLVSYEKIIGCLQDVGKWEIMSRLNASGQEY